VDESKPLAGGRSNNPGGGGKGGGGTGGGKVGRCKLKPVESGVECAWFQSLKLTYG